MLCERADQKTKKSVLTSDFPIIILIHPWLPVHRIIIISPLILHLFATDSTSACPIIINLLLVNFGSQGRGYVAFVRPGIPRNWSRMSGKSACTLYHPQCERTLARESKSLTGFICNKLHFFVVHHQDITRGKYSNILLVKHLMLVNVSN